MFDAAPFTSPCALPQSEHFVRALGAMGIGVHRLEIAEGHGHAVLQSQILPVLGQVGLISRGPVWHGAPDAALLARALARVGFPCVINALAG